MKHVIQTCHKHGAPATSGMAALTISHSDIDKRVEVTRKVCEGKKREIEAGVDGFLVYDSQLVPALTSLWLGRPPNQIDTEPKTFIEITTEDLLKLPEGEVTLNGLKHNVRVGIQFIYSWLHNGVGNFILDGAVEDSATAEIARSQIWQWIYHQAPLEGDTRRPVTKALVNQCIDGLYKTATLKSSTRTEDMFLQQACQILLEVVTATEFPEYITTYLYNHSYFRAAHKHKTTSTMASVIRMRPDTEASEESVYSRINLAHLMESITVNNDKVRYYFNKSQSLRAPLQSMIETLEKLHGTTFTYLSQVPSTGDYSVISTLFELIPALSTMIEWKNLNHSCYWDDFCRETKELMGLLKRVNTASLRCHNVASRIVLQALDLFEEATSKRPPLDNSIEHRQPSDYVMHDTNGQTIQIHWRKHGELELSWHDADVGLLKVNMKDTGVGFKLRFLRHIIHHARTLLEAAYNTFSKLTIALHLEVPIDKLVKCKRVQLKQLTPQEQACVCKAKRELDGLLEVIWKMISRYNFQTFNLFKFKSTYKGLRKSWKYVPKTDPTFVTLTMTVEDSLLMRVISFGIQAQTREESFDFTMFPDRTEDIFSKVEDLLSVDNSNYKQLQLMLNVFRITYPYEKQNFTEREITSTKDELKMILTYRFQIRRYLKKCLEVFEHHPAFEKMDKLKLLTPVKSVSLKGRSDVFLEESTDVSENHSENENMRNNNVASPVENRLWLAMSGGYQVSMDESRVVLVKFLRDGKIKTYRELCTNDKVMLNLSLIRTLLSFMANEQCRAKIKFHRTVEVKSLVKRLKMKDRLSGDLQILVLEHNKHLRLMLQMTKIMRLIKVYL
ncbi:Malate synthase [Orchesella cincta]|uniref:malate synthase n=1 Tax=Orchesella cincta TaxID=48709 RepID=A0A1D2MTL6_ORCCI|nr:Malate synthase [Orchesella cincta]